MRRSGLYVLLVGPDGAGKSTLAPMIIEACSDRLRPSRHMHLRPRLLPRAGALVGRAGGDPSTPHAQSQRQPVLSVFFLGYYWIDFLLGTWLRVTPIRSGGGLALMERGWWDFAVDPRRNRLRVSLGVVETLGRLLPRPDLVLVLEAPPEMILARKRELSAHELARQMNMWRRIKLPKGTKRVYLDATKSLEEIVCDARANLMSLLESRSDPSQVGWIGVFNRMSPRWRLPRGPRRAAKNALLVHQPSTLKGYAGWQIGRLLARMGVFRLFPRAAEPPPEVRSAISALLPPQSTFALTTSNHPGRYHALVLRERGELHAFAKVATDARSREALRKEQLHLETFGPVLPRPLSAPRVVERSEGVLVLEPVKWRPRPNPWRLPEEVAYALGTFYRRTASDRGSLLGVAHGDCAPWNLARTPTGWVLIDWEHLLETAPPFFDLFHFVVQAHWLLGRPSRQAIVAGLDGRGWVGDAISAYAAGSDVDSLQCTAFFFDYLKISGEALDIAKSENAVGLQVRRDLARTLEN